MMLLKDFIKIRISRRRHSEKLLSGYERRCASDVGGLMKNTLILGIESSCDETAASVVKMAMKLYRVSWLRKLRAINDLAG